jgi:AraC-like DNA-binding protein
MPMDFEDLKLKNIDFVVKYTTKTKKFVSRKKPFHIIGIQLTGSALHDFGFQQFTIKPNHIYFLNQDEDYDVDCIEKCFAFSVHFTTYEPIDTHSFCIKVENPTDIIKLIEKIEKQKSLSQDCNNITASNFYKLCSVFDETRKSPYYQKDKRATDAKCYMDIHFKERNCLKHAIETSNLTQRRFNDLFKQTFSITPNRYLTVLKIEFAKKLLKLENLTIMEIAELCGFSDIYYFSKLFKKETGSTPTTFKEK